MNTILKKKKNHKIDLSGLLKKITEPDRAESYRPVQTSTIGK
jgi:hypothetical protein